MTRKQFLRYIQYVGEHGGIRTCTPLIDVVNSRYYVTLLSRGSRNLVQGTLKWNSERQTPLYSPYIVAQGEELPSGWEAIRTFERKAERNFLTEMGLEILA